MKPPIERADIVAAAADLALPDDPVDVEARLSLLRGLHAVGRRDLPLGRLLEGHVDALQIVARYGDVAQRDAAMLAIRGGAVFGVWNADLQGEGTVVADERLFGAKAFASGAGIITHALISADAAEGRRLILLDLAACPPIIDRSWWRVRGMQRSATHVVRWGDVALDRAMRIGRAGDYVREPWFGGGALRFAAAQAGGIAGVVDQVRTHLSASGRDGDPHQARRLAELFLAAQSAADAVATAARCWRDDEPERTLAHVAAARGAVYRSAEQALSLASAAVGVQVMFADDPLGETLADLSTYIRQPAPDAQMMRVGAGVAAGLLVPAL